MYDIEGLHIRACWSEHCMALRVMYKIEHRFGVEYGIENEVRFEYDGGEYLNIKGEPYQGRCTTSG